MTSEQMEARLRAKFSDAQIAVIDTTGTEDHFEVRIQSPALKTLSRVAQHRAINDVFAEELKTGEVHALSIKVI